ATDLIVLHFLPFMPDLAATIWDITGGSGDIKEAAKKYFADREIPADGFSKSGTKLKEGGILFPRITATA
ncbi:MAG: hypothetical protein LBB93_04650, partial [Elusimicrobiota bacterium]|nr:hypothetical protein [Elusimicrobiota bacterium]